MSTDISRRILPTSNTAVLRNGGPLQNVTGINFHKKLCNIGVNTSQIVHSSILETDHKQGYKFETLSTLPKPWSECTRQEIESRDSIIVNNNAQFCSIVRTGIGTTSMVLAGEVDAVLGGKPDDPDTPIPWIELKTSQEFNANDRRELEKFERKMLRFWAQSFLLGVPKIAVGFRSVRGDLLRVDELETQRIPQMVKTSTRVWEGNVSINVTAAFLDFLKQTIVGEGVWRIRRLKSQRRIEVFRVTANGTGEIVKQSFKKHREKLMGLEVAAMLAGGGGAKSDDQVE
nr:decapping nuclease rai1 [Quercus suber]